METQTSPPPEFEETYRQQRLALVRLAFLMCGDRDLSEDLVQSAFTAAHERWSQIANHPAYLRRTVVNLAKDAQRRRFRSLRFQRWAERPDVVLPPDIDETWTQIRELPWAQRAVVVLHYYEDLPLTEVATVLGRPPSTVRSDHRRALDRLRKALR